MTGGACGWCSSICKGFQGCQCAARNQHPSRTISKCVCSGALGMLILIIMVGGGLAFKLMEAMYWEIGISKGGSYAHHHMMLGRLGSLNLFDTTVNILFPIVGVLALKSMKRTENIRETIELATPVCGLNSLCIVCVIMMMHSECMDKHLSSTISSLNMASGNFAGNSTSYTLPPKEIFRYQPVMAVLAIPIPLICSIVCMVAAARNHRSMVSTPSSRLCKTGTCPNLMTHYVVRRTSLHPFSLHMPPNNGCLHLIQSRAVQQHQERLHT